MLSGFYGLGLASLLARDAGLVLLEGAAVGLLTLGFILSTVWAAWLGFELGRTPGPSSPAEPGRWSWAVYNAAIIFKNGQGPA